MKGFYQQVKNIKEEVKRNKYFREKGESSRLY